MSEVQVTLLVAASLFSIGLCIVVIKRNAVMILLGIELMLNAANLNLIAFNRVHPADDQGQMFALFVIVVAVCETAVGLAIILQIYRYRQTIIPDEMDQLKDS